MAIEVAAGFDLAFGFELALGFAASVQQSIGRCRSFGPLPFGALARVAKVNDVTHPALDESLRGLKIVVRGFGAKCAHSVARRRAASSSIARPASTKPDERAIELNYAANTQVLRQYLRAFFQHGCGDYLVLSFEAYSIVSAKTAGRNGVAGYFMGKI